MFFTIILDVFDDDNDLDQTLLELPDMSDTAVGQALQVSRGLLDSTESGQTSESNPGAGDPVLLLSGEIQERMEISLHRTILRKELMSIFEHKDIMTKFVVVKMINEHGKA